MCKAKADTPSFIQCGGINSGETSCTHKRKKNKIDCRLGFRGTPLVKFLF